MESAFPSFLTHHELDRILGGGTKGPRKRQRLQARNLLPEPYDLGRVHRVDVKVFPSFVLAGLIADLRESHGALEGLECEVKESLASESFAELMGPLRQVTGEAGAWSFEAICGRLAEVAPGELRGWADHVSGSERRLQQWGIAITHRQAWIEAIDSGVYLVGAGDWHDQVPCERVTAQLAPGDPVGVEQIAFRGATLGFLWPWVEAAPAEDAAEEELGEWFKKAMTPTPAGEEVGEEDPTNDERLPYGRALGPRHRRLTRPSTMTRVPAGH